MSNPIQLELIAMLCVVVKWQRAIVIQPLKLFRYTTIDLRDCIA
jgi:hypothetical protein